MFRGRGVVESEYPDVPKNKAFNILNLLSLMRITNELMYIMNMCWYYHIDTYYFVVIIVIVVIVISYYRNNKK